MTIPFTKLYPQFIVQLLPAFVFLSIFNSMYTSLILIVFTFIGQQIGMYSFHRGYHQYGKNKLNTNNDMHGKHHDNRSPHGTLELYAFLTIYMWTEPLTGVLFYTIVQSFIGEIKISLLFCSLFYGMFLSFLDHMVAHIFKLCKRSK
jgi:hypothetical protein